VAFEIGILLALATFIAWGAADFLAKKGVDKVGAVTSLLINQAAALGPILVIALVFSPLPTLSVNLVLLAAVTGLLGFVGYFFLYKGLRKGNLSVVSPISASWFVITTIVAMFLFNETLGVTQIVGVVVVFAGVFFASTNLSEFRRNITKSRSNGATEALVAMVAWGFAFAFIKPVVDMSGPFVALLLARAISFVFLFTYIGVTKTKLAAPNRRILFILISAGLLDAFGYAAFNVSVTTEFVSTISPITAAYPAVTLLLARVFLKEKLEQTQKIGVASILVGLVLMAIS
jgi:drug/metabolite transporter (DMT)-like permease